MSLTARGYHVLAAKFAAVAVGYAFVAFLSRRLDAPAFGQVAFFLSFAALISVIGGRGQHMAVLRFVPGSGPQAAAIFAAARRRAAAGTAATALVLLALALGLRAAGLLAGFGWPVLALGMSLGAVAGWSDFVAHRARAAGRILLSILPKEVVWRLLALAVLAASWPLVPPGQASALAVLALLILLLAALNIGVSAVLPALPGADGAPPPEWRRASGPFWLSSVSGVFLAHADVAVVGVLLGPAEAGLYFVANRLAQVLGYFMVSQNVVIAPELARAHQSGDRDALGLIGRRATRAMSWPTLIAGAALWAAAGPVLSLFDPGFAEAAPVLRWLVLAACLNAATGPGDIVMNMSGHERAAMRVAAAALAASALLLPLGAAAAGAEGVALAVLAATALRKLAYSAALWSRLGLRVDIFAGVPA